MAWRRGTQIPYGGRIHGPSCNAKTQKYTSCPHCEAPDVYFFTCDCGSRVYFDAIGPPWPKHQCTKAKSTDDADHTRQTLGGRMRYVTETEAEIRKEAESPPSIGILRDGIGIVRRIDGQPKKVKVSQYYSCMKVYIEVLQPEGEAGPILGLYVPHQQYRTVDLTEESILYFEAESELNKIGSQKLIWLCRDIDNPQMTT